MEKAILGALRTVTYKEVYVLCCLLKTTLHLMVASLSRVYSRLLAAFWSVQRLQSPRLSERGRLWATLYLSHCTCLGWPTWLPCEPSVANGHNSGCTLCCQCLGLLRWRLQLGLTRLIVWMIMVACRQRYPSQGLPSTCLVEIMCYLYSNKVWPLSNIPSFFWERPYLCKFYGWSDIS